VLAALASVVLCPAQPVVTVHGLGASAVSLSLADLAKLPQQTVHFADRKQPVAFAGVLLLDVLSKVDLSAGEKFHKTRASYYVVVDAADGYKAVFAWAELDPDLAAKKVYLVTAQDGKPLAAADGPFRLIVPDDKAGSRSVHQVTAFTLKQAS